MFEQRKSPSKIYQVLSPVQSRKINRNRGTRPHITERGKKDKLSEEAYNFLTFLPFGNTVILRSCDLQKKNAEKERRFTKPVQSCSFILRSWPSHLFALIEQRLKLFFSIVHFFFIPSAPYLIWLVFNRTPWQHMSLHRLLSNISHLRRHLMFLCADSITH